MPRKKEDVLYKVTGGDFIDPRDTGSFIRYKAYVTVTKGKTPDKDYLNIDFTMSLGDCNRVINWNFQEYDEDDLKLDKIETAIQILQDFKRDIHTGQGIIRKERKRIDKAEKDKEEQEKKNGNKDN